MYLVQHGMDVLLNGYNVYPVRPRTKGIYEDDWQTSVADANKVAQWIEERPKAGISILTGTVIAIDVDVYDKSAADAVINLAFSQLGDTIYRVGERPKALLVYRVAEPIAKITSDAYDTGSGRKPSRVEVLGKGQQFVAYNVHPDTGQPYEWFGGAPHDVATWELPCVTYDQLLAFVSDAQVLLAERFPVIRKGRTGQLRPQNDDDWLDAANNRKAPVAIDRDEIDDRLADVVRFVEDYDFWLSVGMALHHQFRGSSEGMDIWDSWSQHGSNYDADAIAAKWSSFDASASGGTTFRSVMHHANLARLEAKWSATDTYRDRINNAQEVTHIIERVCKEIAADDLLSPAQRDMLASAVSNKLKAMGSPMSMSQVRKAVRPPALASVKPDAVIESCPWLHGWSFVTLDNLFYCIDDGRIMDSSAFDRAFGRKLMTDSARLDGLARPEVTPSDFAVNVACIPVVDGIGFQPADVYNPVYYFNGRTLANGWRDTGPKAIHPDDWDDDQRNCVEIFQQHVKNCAVERPNVLMCYLAHIVQHRGHKIRWAPLLLGPQGSGKSVWCSIMGGILGGGNTLSVSQAVLVSGYLRTLVQTEFVMLDELKSRAHRFDIELALRDLITNPVVTTTEKHLKPLTQPNHTNFMGTSNFDDALPLEEGDRRWYVDRSVFNTKADVRRWDSANPDYFATLQRIGNDPALAGAVKWFLLHYKIDDPVFLACRTQAPETEAKRRMVRASENPAAEIIRDVAALSDCSLLSDRIMSIALLRKRLAPLGVDKALCDPTDLKLPRILRESLGMAPSELRIMKPRHVRHVLYVLPDVTEDEISKAVADYDPDDSFAED